MMSHHVHHALRAAFASLLALAGALSWAAIFVAVFAGTAIIMAETLSASVPAGVMNSNHLILAIFIALVTILHISARTSWAAFFLHLFLSMLRCSFDFLIVLFGSLGTIHHSVSDAFHTSMICLFLLTFLLFVGFHSVFLLCIKLSVHVIHGLVNLLVAYSAL